VRREADRLGVTTTPTVSVLADGGEWIWNLAADVVPQATGVLDVFHAVEDLAEAVKAVFGPGTEATTAHTQAGRRALLAGGKLVGGPDPADAARGLGGAARQGLGVLGEPPDAPGLHGPVGVGPQHRQRRGRRGDQTVGEPADETIRRPPEGEPRRPARGTLSPVRHTGLERPLVA